MSSLRMLIARNRRIAALLIAMTLLVRALVPVGFMPDFSGGSFTIALCSGTGPATVTLAVAPHSQHHDADKIHADMACPYAALAMPTLGGADPIQLARAVAAIVLLGLIGAVTVTLLARGHLRPPLRGPPAAA